MQKDVFFYSVIRYKLWVYLYDAYAK